MTLLDRLVVQAAGAADSNSGALQVDVLEVSGSPPRPKRQPHASPGTPQDHSRHRPELLIDGGHSVHGDHHIPWLNLFRVRRRAALLAVGHHVVPPPVPVHRLQHQPDPDVPQIAAEDGTFRGGAASIDEALRVLQQFRESQNESPMARNAPTANTEAQ
eukprot:CAMPEP_0180353554 /NCGR_PEP_ID=MMETSP0989-20121125/7704_1 /TAXON_ID=697907 /ORGANISM="non described non described, Strain CCMP2293" /LENGTH=158 /DNA_ID=CAMNT_0022343231 /DNA_START=372 /DNA_END=847 /DNA_ORIENTATION=-